MAGKIIRAVIDAHLCDRTWWAIIVLAWVALVIWAT